MAIALGELELEGLNEFENEFEHEAEHELEHEQEHEFEHELEHEFEHEGELELEHESFGEISPVTRIYPDGMMEHLAHAAMEAESEHEAAEGFLPLIGLAAGKLLPLAARALPRIGGRALPRVAQAINRVTPRLTRSVNHLTRTLYRNPRTRPLLRVLPTVARRTVGTLVRQAAAGGPMTPRQAVQTMAWHRRRILSNPQIVGRILRRSRLMDGRYHRLAGVPASGRHYRWRWRNGLWQPGMAAAPRTAGTRPIIAGADATRVCPTCGTTAVHTRGGQGCSVIVIR
jgi:hypothetical protein